MAALKKCGKNKTSFEMCSENVNVFGSKRALRVQDEKNKFHDKSHIVSVAENNCVARVQLSIGNKGLGERVEIRSQNYCNARAAAVVRQRVQGIKPLQSPGVANPWNRRHPVVALQPRTTVAVTVPSRSSVVAHHQSNGLLALFLSFTHAIQGPSVGI